MQERKKKHKITAGASFTEVLFFINLYFINYEKV